MNVGCKCYAAVHLVCAVEAAKADEAMWMRCPKCDHRWSGELDKSLLEAAPKPADHRAGKCRVCQQEASDDTELLDCGCACRSTARQPIHLACAVTLAEQNSRRWRCCPTCEDRWAGDLKLPLARERCRVLANRPDEDSDRLSAEMDLSKTLRLQGKLEEALEIGSHAFRVYTKGRRARFSEQLEVETEVSDASTVEDMES